MVSAALALFVASALLTPLLTRHLRRWVFLPIALVPAATFVWTATLGPEVIDGGAVVETATWIAQLGIAFDFRIDALAWILALIVTGVGALVLVYCAFYFDDDEPGLGRFAALLLLFSGVMFGLVTADDVIVMFVFWEATSVLSYLLIGHYTDRKESRGAALQALIVTTLGGLAMLVGLIILIVQAGTSTLSGIVAAAPDAPIAGVAIALVLAGAISKSAIFPFHFWLPAAMAAPTPVSAYLHAAAMVKAGVYLIARLSPGFSDLPAWLPIIVILGGWTMIAGGWRSLRQYDLKLVLAHGTVSQLGFMVMVMGLGSRDIALAGLALVIAHALFKATLFLVVGIVDHAAGTRDWRELSGVGRQLPVVTVIAVLAAASMAGIIPLLGFAAKEAVLSSVLERAQTGDPWAWTAMVAIVIGSILTVAYTARFLWGAFARKRVCDLPGSEAANRRWLTPTSLHRPGVGILIAPGLLALAGLVLGLGAGWLDPALAAWADTVPGDGDYHFALWHGLEPALFISAGIIAAGILLFLPRRAVGKIQTMMRPDLDAARGYWWAVHQLDRLAAAVTSFAQRGGLPGYLGTILGVLVISLGAGLLMNRSWPSEILIADYPAQVAIAAIMIVAAVSAARAKQRMTAVLLVGATGYGMVLLFGLHGAPDLALTQALVETIVLVVVVLVMRRLPSPIAQRNKPVRRKTRALVGIAVGAIMAAVVLVAMGARSSEPISLMLPEMAYDIGHGRNVVNVMLVDIRAWDTLGELSVLIVVATGVASLIFVSKRTGQAPRMKEAGGLRRGLVRPVSEPRSGTPTRTLNQITTEDESGRRTWLLAGRSLSPERRSILIEVLVRLLFHPAIIVSIYLLFVGHNAPGGGFAGGLLAGLALTARYLAAGRFELGEAAPVDAGRLLGAGMLLAAGTAVSSLFFGLEVLQATWFEYEIPILGTISIGTSTLFDIGVYLVVIGLILDVLRSLGGELDRQIDEADHPVETTGAMS